MNTTKPVITEVADLIHGHGGPAKVADLLGYDKAAGGVQRVHNWLTRGIPAQVKLDYPAIFLRSLGKGAEPAPQAIAPEGLGAFGDTDLEKAYQKALAAGLVKDRRAFARRDTDRQTAGQTD